MNKRRERNLDVVSGIDEVLIDNATKARIRYFNNVGKRKKKNFITVIAIAAAVAILMSLAAVILVPFMSKQVPVYTGMTVSSEDGTQTARVDGIIPLSSIIMLDNNNTEGNNGNHGSNNPNKKPIGDIINVESGKEIYYAKPGETVRITIHFDNPDQYEILSFTLNGEKYGSHMFLEGSDMEELTVNYTISDSAEGIAECTIDAIKYVDGEKIKDVKIGGDRTVKIGIYTEKQPTALIENETVGTFDVSFDVTVTDSLGLISLSGGKLCAVLADDENILKTYDLNVGEKGSVRFDGLDPEKYYRYGVVAVYDAFDGEGFTAHTLFEAPLNRYSLTYIMNGGYNSPSNPTEYWAGKAVAVENPSKTGYIFLGWTYKGQNEPQKDVVLAAGTRGDMTLTANWRNVFEDMVLPSDNPAGVGIIDFDVFGSDNKRGLILYAPEGSEIRCILDGTVSHVDPRYGVIDIKAKIGDTEITAVYFNAHNPETIFTDKFRVGDEVSKGTVVGKMLKSPSSPNGSLCAYFSLYIDGEELDPLKCFPQETAQKLADKISLSEYFTKYCNAKKGFNEAIERVISPTVSDKNVSIVKDYSEDHRAIDVASDSFFEGVYAIADGSVTRIWNDADHGYSVAVKCGSITITYQNLANEDIEGIKVGASVNTGALIGHIGNTSTAEGGEKEHLHLAFEYSPGVYVNP